MLAMDRNFLGLTPTDDEGVWRLPVTDKLVGMMGQLFGGFAIGAAVSVFEELTGRTARWATAQFYKMTFAGDVLTLRLELVSQGRSVVQGRVSFESDGDEIIHVLVAGGAKGYEREMRGPAMPSVPPPEACGPGVDFGFEQIGIIAELDIRVADATSTTWTLDQQRAATTLWMRFAGHRAGDPISLAVMADYIPPAVSAAVADHVFASSFDNTIRYVEYVDDDWILVDFQIEAVRAGIAHATSRLWSADGRLLAVASQTSGVSKP